MKRKIERFLYARGFTSALLREIVVVQWALAGISLLSGLALFPAGAGAGLLAFSAAAALFALNFWFLSVFVFGHFQAGYSRQFLLGQIIRFVGRFIFTGVALALLLLYGAPPVWLGLGLLAPLAAITALALLRSGIFKPRKNSGASRAAACDDNK